MLFFMFAEEELRRIFDRLGYEYTPDTARKNIAYYEPRTTHGSTLSFVVHAAILADLDPKSSWISSQPRWRATSAIFRAAPQKKASTWG